MTPTLIVLVLLLIAAGIVIVAVRRKPAAPSRRLPDDGDTAWNDPITPARSPDPLRPDTPRPGDRP